MPDEAYLLSEITNYWTSRANTYSESVNKSLAHGEDQSWMVKITRFADLSRPLKILDVGTGPGFFPMLLGSKGHDVTGIDCTTEMLAAAKANCDNRNIKANFVQMDAQKLDFEDESFDIIISRNVTWNLENPRKAYLEWFRDLKNGGKVIVFDGNHYLQLHDEEYRVATADDEDPHKNSRYIGSTDTYVMREIAENLPLSRERRPQWDVCTLIELGYTDVYVCTENLVRLCPDGCDPVSVPKEFSICATRK